MLLFIGILAIQLLGSVNNKITQDLKCESPPSSGSKFTVVDLSTTQEYGNLSKIYGCELNFNTNDKRVNAEISVVFLYTCTFTSIQNSDSQNGGAIYIRVTSSLSKSESVIYNCAFESCKSVVNGGAIYIDSSQQTDSLILRIVHSIIMKLIHKVVQFTLVQFGQLLIIANS